MKQLTMLLTLLIMASVLDARTVPGDSLAQYLEMATQELTLHSVQIRFIDFKEESEGNGEYVNSIADKVFGSVDLVDNMATYFAIARTCGFDENICHGISINCEKLEKIHSSLEIAVLAVKEEDTLKQLWKAKVYLHYLLVDIVDSVSDKECLKEMRERINQLYYDPSAFGM